MTEQGRIAQAEASRRKALWLESLGEGLAPAWVEMATELMTLLARRASQKTPAPYT